MVLEAFDGKESYVNNIWPPHTNNIGISHSVQHVIRQKMELYLPLCMFQQTSLSGVVVVKGEVGNTRWEAGGGGR
jgi:hypothetical protein